MDQNNKEFLEKIEKSMLQNKREEKDKQRQKWKKIQTPENFCIYIYIYIYIYIERERERERENRKANKPKLMNLLEGNSMLKRLGFKEHSSGH